MLLIMITVWQINNDNVKKAKKTADYQYLQMDFTCSFCWIIFSYSSLALILICS